MEHHIEVNLGVLHLERRWYNHWENKLELIEVPLMGSPEDMVIEKLREFEWGRLWEKYVEKTDAPPIVSKMVLENTSSLYQH